MAYLYDSPGTNQDYLRMGLVQKGYHCIILKYGKIAPPRASTGASAAAYLTEATLTTTTPSGLPSAGTVSSWTAYVAPITEGRCREQNARGMTGFRAVQTAAGNPRDFPAVTRFMLDRHDDPSIGIRCEQGWCVLGGDLASLPAMNHKVTGAGATKARQLVYGWYDDQKLAIAPDPATPTKLVPWQRASIVPHPDLDIYKIDVDFKDRWAPVATVILSGKPSGKYRDKWGFVGSGHEDTVYFKHVSPYNETSWQVRVNGSVRRGIKVYWTDHGSAAFLVSTARWVWKDSDDGIWIRCEFGCCEAESS